VDVDTLELFTSSIDWGNESSRRWSGSPAPGQSRPPVRWWCWCWSHVHQVRSTFPARHRRVLHWAAEREGLALVGRASPRAVKSRKHLE